MSDKITTYSISVNSNKPPYMVTSSDEKGTGTHSPGAVALDEKGTGTHLPMQIVNELAKFMLETKGHGQVVISFVSKEA